MPKIVSFTKKEQDEMVRLYTKKGLTVADLARHFKCSGTPVLRVLRDRAVPMRPQGDEIKQSRNNKIMDMKDDGYTDDQIAQALGISRQRVHQIVSRGY